MVGGDLTRRGLDLLAATLLVVLTAPLLLVCALAVWIGSGRPVLFGHLRLGRGGGTFRCWKFRSMLADAEAELNRTPTLKQRYLANGFKLRAHEDPRVTAVGRRLRRWHLDELPQLFNVLEGTMSLVGPRPVVPGELSEYEPHGGELLRVRPGIFGAWTSLGRRRPDYPERARLELRYVRCQRLGTDLAILLRSIPTLLQDAPDQ
jgi:exopolysaccharide production protein ExoY